ncbi:ArsR/SmtB family transcription factor [Paenibacillus marinisediminis]
MKQVQFMTLEHYDQLKSLSDPLRCRIVSLLIAKSYTGQQLSQELDIPRAKIHYHLNELERNGLIAVVKNEVKNGIIQKFYRSVARGFVPAPHLMPNADEFGGYLRESTIHALERARMRAIMAPERAFAIKSADRSTWPRLTVQIQVKMTEEKIAEWHEKYRALIEELLEMEMLTPESEGNWYYLISSGFEIDEPWFDDTDTDAEPTINASGSRNDSVEENTLPATEVETARE